MSQSHYALIVFKDAGVFLTIKKYFITKTIELISPKIIIDYVYSRGDYGIVIKLNYRSCFMHLLHKEILIEPILLGNFDCTKKIACKIESNLIKFSPKLVTINACKINNQ